VLPSDELDETYASSLILAYLLHYVKTLHRPQNRKYITYVIVIGAEWVTGHVYIKFFEILTFSFLRYANKQTDGRTNKQTDRYRDADRDTLPRVK